MAVAAWQERVTGRIAPMLGRIARQWAPVEGSSSRQQERIVGLLETLAQANRSGGTPERFLRATSRGLGPLLPHEYLELLVSDRVANTADEARTIAQSTLDKLASGSFEAEGAMEGVPAVKAGGKLLPPFSKADQDKIVETVHRVWKEVNDATGPVAAKNYERVKAALGN